MTQDEIVRQAKEGKPQAIATLIGKSLEPKGMVTKVASNNGCLTVHVEAQTAPPQQSVNNFVKTGLLNLKPDNISQVIIQGRVTGQPKAAWQETFSLATSESKPSASPLNAEVSKPPITVRQTTPSRISISTSKSSSSRLETLTEFVKTRNGERVALVLGTAVLTSVCWLGVGTLSSHPNSSVPVASTNGTEVVSSVPSQDSGLYSVKGTFQLVDSEIGGTASDCYGTGGYDDVEAGMPVTIRDGNGAILATGRVDVGTQPVGSEYSRVICNFTFQVDSVPQADFYAIAIGRRGELNYSFAEMQEKNWTVQLSLGT